MPLTIMLLEVSMILLTNALLHNRGRELWSEAKKIRQSNLCVSSVVNMIPTADLIVDSALAAQATSVGDELCCSAGVLIVAVRPCQPTPPPTALVEGKGAN